MSNEIEGQLSLFEPINKVIIRELETWHGPARRTIVRCDWICWNDETDED